MCLDDRPAAPLPAACRSRDVLHPATIFVFTWNPGFEDDPDRPGQAPLSRMATFRLDAPTLDESKRRASAFFNALDGQDALSTDNEQRRQDILKRSYGIPGSITPTERELDAATNFWNDIRMHAIGGVGERDLGKTSPTSTAPGPRELQRFVALVKGLGNDWQQAASIFDICCDQDPSLFPEQKRLVMERFTLHFGEDGQASAGMRHHRTSEVMTLMSHAVARHGALCARPPERISERRNR